ncbi:MAG: hypothetical protein JNK77_12250 [Saprospiraceae bacterium]|nr:hypothetical protein [Saprospiraceae bacterium]
MKKVIILLFLGFWLQANAQAQHETLFNNARVKGGFAAPIVEIGINNQISTSVGGGGGLVIGSAFVGGYGMGSVDFNKLFEDGDVKVAEIGHGGFWLGGTFRPHKVIHLYGSTRIGWGGLDIELENDVQDVDRIFVFTPELGVELNVTRWFRVAGTAGYRLVNGSNEARGYTDKDFSGWFTGLTFRIGWFGSRRW